MSPDSDGYLEIHEALAALGRKLDARHADKDIGEAEASSGISQSTSTDDRSFHQDIGACPIGGFARGALSAVSDDLHAGIGPSGHAQFAHGKDSCGRSGACSPRCIDVGSSAFDGHPYPLLNGVIDTVFAPGEEACISRIGDSCAVDIPVPIGSFCNDKSYLLHDDGELHGGFGPSGHTLFAHGKDSCGRSGACAPRCIGVRSSAFDGHPYPLPDGVIDTVFAPGEEACLIRIGDSCAVDIPVPIGSFCNDKSYLLHDHDELHVGSGPSGLLISHTVKTAVVAAALARLAVLMSEVLLLTATLLLCASELSTRSSLLERRLAFYELENPMRVTSLSLVDLSATTNPIYCMAMVPDEYIPLHPIRIVEPVSATHVQCKAPTRAAPS
jgi:hypothetical protein